ncbi:MAG: Mut7-C ubiquitin/RNAse domain-containing protein [Gammaproteobacteria bacterium]|nr:Mut7-C ubiquitin/RNAse domain-containing protein [Gammaproteobacteria bacterium]NIR85435.1 Mut7-C ubiquitin/RNAse domain-containing protein [Gammaproteobacteria bacterium]NIR89426.1 Mut7-C ubiquitin/RNAse domain-containing protein [Gammaproteobacteria bacterium]NIU06571.1 Mut7-C ubiquitin/RNAse domain-containing protein [Gammaproteobacteria bacterium]NIV53454.1 twitching motility protein PilT [Gammaproteobacteria bacterium]
MPVARFRFYEELNDFLPGPRRKRAFAHRCAREATVKHAIEALGVPHTEVELILVNGESVDFGHRVREGDRISVYPKFESFDVSPLLRVRERPLRRPRFIADAHLGGLCKYLRMLGLDTLSGHGLSDAGIVSVAAREGRIVLTRDRDLLMHRAVTHGCYLRARKPREQLVEVLSRLDLYRHATPFTRCMRCNGLLSPVAKERIAHGLPPRTDSFYDRFWACRGCGKVYWQGSHYNKMEQFVDELLSSRNG